MTFYFGISFCLIIILSIMEKRKKIIWLVPFMILFLISALRADGMGADFESYREVFYQINSGYGGYEILYTYLNRICSFLGGYRAVVILVSFLSLIGVIYFVKSNSLKPSISIWLYITMGFYTWTFTIYRQAIAISLVLCAYEFARRKDLFKFILFILLATGFHTLSVLLIIMYPILNIKNIKKLWVPISVVAVFLLFFFQRYILNIIKFISGMFGARFAYYDLNQTQTEFGGETLAVFYLLVFGAVILLTVQAWKKKKRVNTDIIVYSSLSVICQMVAVSFPLANRMGLFFTIPTFLLLPNIIENEFDYKSKKLCYIFIIIISALYLVIILYQDYLTGSHIVPYRSIF